MTEKECKYYHERICDRYGNTNFEYCYLYNDKCDKYPQCIFRDERLQQYKTQNKELKNYINSCEYQLEKRIEICDSWLDLSNKYKQCLNDIENLIQKGINCGDCESLDCNMCYKNFRNKILQYIKETKE